MWLAYALGALLLTSSLGILFSVVSVKSKDARTFGFLFNFTIFLMTVVLVLAVGVGPVRINPWIASLMLCSGFGYGLFQRYQFVVRKHLSAPEIQVLVTPASAAGYILAILWLHEAVTPLRVLGYLLITIATLLVIKRKGLKFSFNRYVLLLIFIGVSLSLAGTIDRRVVPHFDHLITYTAILWLAQTISCYIPYVKRDSLKQELALQSWRIPLLAIINLAALFCQVSAIKLAAVTRVAPITSMNVVLVAILSIVFLKDRDRIPAKLGAATIATIGLILVSR